MLVPSLLHRDAIGRLAVHRRLGAQSRLVCSQGSHTGALCSQRSLHGPGDHSVHRIRQTDGRDLDERVADAQEQVLFVLQGCLGERFELASPNALD